MAEGLQLSQKLAMQQTLAPQLQQSLALLQAPILELRALVEQELQQNPVLEEAPSLEAERRDGSEAATNNPADPAEPPPDTQIDPTRETDQGPADDFQAEFERLAKIDEEWRDYFSQTNLPLRSREDQEEKRRYFMESLVAQTSLQQHLLEQARLADLGEEDRRLVEQIIGNIDDNGYLRATVNELALAGGFRKEDVERALRVVQSFDPPGVGARDLRECLLLQLERIGKENSVEYQIIRDHMKLLARRRIPELARSLNLSIPEVQAAVERIARLEPRPGREFSHDVNAYVVPELTVQKSGDEFTVTLNNEFLPRLRISNAYKDLMARADSPTEVRDYIRNRIRAGKFLIKCLQQRQQTLLKIAREIVRRQKEFFEKGPGHLKPLTMAQIAEAVGVHETTVSRAVSGKYVQTPHGVFELRDFFSSGIQTVDGGEVANAAVKELIAEMIRREDPKKPLSDEDIVQRLREKGIRIARRTVAKYRSELHILPSHLRRMY